MTQPSSNVRRRLNEDDGAILVLSAFLLIILFTLAALAIDITMKSNDRQYLWNSADAAALAGASQLPDDGLSAEALAMQFAIANDADLAGNLTTGFRCLVGDRDDDGQPDAADIPAACDPGADIAITAPPFVCADGICTAPCVPADGDRCNTIVLNANATTPYAFAPAIGIDEGTSSVVSAACRGSCGGAVVEPVDVIIIIDRTGSMTATDLQQAKDAALAMLDFFNPTLQHVGLAVLGAGDAGVCNDLKPENGGSWLGVGLSSDYKDILNWDINGDGTLDLDSTSKLVNKINCLNHSSQGTNLGSPIKDTVHFRPDALSELLNNGRPGVRKGIILLSDGGANEPGDDDDDNNCSYANKMASQAKAAGVEIFTIGFGLAGLECEDDDGRFEEEDVTKLLASMATQPSKDNCSAANPAKENSDDDHFFCLPKTQDLSKVFLSIAAELAAGSQLVYLPPGG
ncbi:MAG: VWA domain-containing protein [Acidimicrobiia bacterium]